MRDYWKVLAMSLAFHGLIFLIAVRMGNSLPPLYESIVVDFTIEDTRHLASHAKDSPEEPHLPRNVREVKSASSPTDTHQTPSVPPESHAPSPVGNSGTTPGASERMQGTSSVADTRPSTASPDAGTTPAGVQTVSSARQVPGEGEASSFREEKNRYLKQNLSYIRDLIQKKLVYPRIARQMGWAGKVILSFIVCADGSVRDVRIKETSGIDFLDRHAIETVTRSVPLPKPPLEAQVVIPITYSLR